MEEKCRPRTHFLGAHVSKGGIEGSPVIRGLTLAQKNLVLQSPRMEGVLRRKTLNSTLGTVEKQREG